MNEKVLNEILNGMLNVIISYIVERRILSEKDMELSDGYAEASYYGGRMDEAENILNFIKGLEVDRKLREEE